MCSDSPAPNTFTLVLTKKHSFQETSVINGNFFQLLPIYCYLSLLSYMNDN